MSEEELIDFIKKNLSIQIDETGGGCSCCCGPPTVTIKIKLKNEIISEDFFNLPQCEHKI